MAVEGGNMAFDNNFIDELKMKVNIVDVIGREVALKRAGANYKGLCPFHSEKTPSFMVNEERQIFNCFGCQEKGDVIAFVQKYYKLPFMEAVEKLCNEYGIKMPERVSSGPRIDYDKYYEINRKAARFFYDKLTKGRNPGLAYLNKRGLSHDTINKFGLGYAPDSGNALSKYLVSEGVEEEDILKLGLANRGKSGLYDRFRGRVIFPIFNTTGKVIGFGGRALNNEIKPKYLNSAESEIFLKKNNLYGLNFTKKDISDEDRVLIVEGYMDAISLYQGGVHNVAASLGTALTDNQAKLICRYTKNVVLSYDSDKAGIAAALKGIDVIRGAGGRTRILRVRDAKDPDEFISKYGREAFLRLVDEAIYATDFKLELLKRNYEFKDDLEVIDFIRKCVPILRELGPVERDLYQKKLAEEFNISENSIALEVRTDREDGSPSVNHLGFTNQRSSERRRSASPDRFMKLEMSFLILSINNTRYLKRLEDDAVRFESRIGTKILSVCKSICDNAENGLHRIDLVDLCRNLDPEDESTLRHFADIIKLGPDDEVFYKECLNSFKLQQYNDRKLELLNRLSVAEKLNDDEELLKCTAELMDINTLINKLSEEKNA